MNTRDFTLPLLYGAALMLSFSAQPRADGDNPGASAYLSTDEALIGSSVTITLRSPLVGDLAVIAFGLTPTPVVFGGIYPTLHVGVPFLAPSGVIGPEGLLSISAPIAAAFPPGVEVYLQAAVITPLPVLTVYGSAPLRLAPGGGGAPFNAAGSGVLPGSTALSGATDVDWVDVNRDGLDDVFVATEGLPNLLINLGGTFADQAALRLPAAAMGGIGHVEAADVDSDGDPDLFLGAAFDPSAPAANLLLVNQGGFYSVDAQFPAGAGRPIDAEFGDVDSDGDLDLVVANSQDNDHPSEVPDGVVLYINAGGQFTAQPGFGSVPGTGAHASGGSVALGDVDRDGDLDLYVARADTAAGGLQNSLLANDGAGSFTDITSLSIPPMVDNTFEAEFVDVNGDGWLDIAAANSITSVTTAHHLLLSFGVSPFTGQVAYSDASALLVPPSFGPATKIRLGLDVADVDGDGDPDLLYSIHQLFDDFGMLDGDAALLLNQGGIQGGTLGAFALDPSFVVPGSGFVCSDAAFGDADHDGDLDLFLASDGDLFGMFPPADVLMVNGS
jgi:hypothetical protein